MQLGLCGMSGLEVAVVGDSNPKVKSYEFALRSMIAFRAIFEAEYNHNFTSVTFSFMKLTRYEHLHEAMKGLNGKRVFTIFRAELPKKRGPGRMYIYVVVQTKKGNSAVRLFARSFPTTHESPGPWMNRSEDWDFIDYSLGGD